ncbi:hypothetical protein CAMSH0001_2401 [Campylobacter showae RM3277]|uniref:Uncharacterized protein n=1 Tax=Campylobacter showae RM3277 TaxID=553219 RepID=C6RCM7_9BACT|nr:hypothetical protein CAMSH0001_2401 [Campylobacter showae RM3277]
MRSELSACKFIAINFSWQRLNFSLCRSFLNSAFKFSQICPDLIFPHFPNPPSPNSLKFNRPLAKISQI